jgi:hypothetical protein
MGLPVFKEGQIFSEFSSISSGPLNGGRGRTAAKKGKSEKTCQLSNSFERKRLSIRAIIAHRTACQFYYAIDNRPGTPHQAPATARATVDGRGGNSENICPSLQMLRVAAGREGIGSMSQGTNAKAGAAFDEGWSEVMTLCLGIRFVRR